MISFIFGLRLHRRGKSCPSTGAARCAPEGFSALFGAEQVPEGGAHISALTPAMRLILRRLFAKMSGHCALVLT